MMKKEVIYLECTEMHKDNKQVYRLFIISFSIFLQSNAKDVNRSRTSNEFLSDLWGKFSREKF